MQISPISIDDLRRQVFAGEDGRHQFKENITNSDSLAAEIVAFSNSEGGTIYIGVSDKGELQGVSPSNVRRINQLIADTATNCVRSPVHVQTQNVVLDNDRIVIVLTIPKGYDKPHYDKKGVIWVKVGSDKRRINSKEDLKRFFRHSHQFHADMLSANVGLERLDKLLFRDFLERTHNFRFPDEPEEQIRLLRNMNLATKEGMLNLACVLMFGLQPEKLVPQFVVKVMCCPGTEIPIGSFWESEDFGGVLEKIYQDSYAFIMRNLHKIQGNQDVNVPGMSEIHPVVLEEILLNALIHRDYFVCASIRIFMYDDRVEVISPGHLPNNLTTEAIRNGNVNLRNPVLASYVAKGILPYHGLGTGIRRALAACPDIILRDEREENLFSVIIPRRSHDAFRAAMEKATSVSEEATSMSEKATSASEKTASVSEKTTLASEKATFVSEKTNSVSEKMASVSEKTNSVFHKDPTSSARSIAAQLGISSRTVERHLALLRRKGIVQRTGPAKGGSWVLR